MTSEEQFLSERFPRSSKYNPEWIITSISGRIPNAQPRDHPAIRKSTRNLVKPLRVQASMVRKSAAAATSRCRDKNSFQVVLRSPSSAGHQLRAPTTASLRSTQPNFMAKFLSVAA
jgi:hypothetical protein